MQISVLKFSDLEKIYILAVLKYLTSLKRFTSQLLGQMMVMYLTTNAAISVIVQMRRCCFSSENFVSDFFRLLEGGLHYAFYLLHFDWYPRVILWHGHYYHKIEQTIFSHWKYFKTVGTNRCIANTFWMF